MRDKSMAQVLLILSPSVMLVALGMDIIIPCIPAISTDLDSGTAITQWVLSAYFLGTAIGQLIIGPLADSYGRRRILLLSAIIFIFSSLACGIATQIQFLIPARLLQGVGACGTLVAVSAIIRDLYDGQAMPKAYSYLNGVVALAPILAPMIGGFLLVSTGSWRNCFYFASAFGMFALITNFTYLQESLTEKYIVAHISFKKIISNYISIFTNRDFLCYNICAISGLTGLLLFFSISPIIMIKILNISPDTYSLYFAINFISYLIGNIISPRLEMNINKLILLGSSIILFGALFMLCWHILILISLIGLVIPALIMGFGIGLIYGPCTAGAMDKFKHIAGTASAAYGAMLYFASSIIVALIMLYPVYNTVSYALVMIFMSLVNMTLMLVKRYIT